MKKFVIPAEIWRRDADHITRLFIEDKAVTTIALDDTHQTADADYSNNVYPPRIRKSRLELDKSDPKHRNLMKDLLVELQVEAKAKADSKTVLITPQTP